MPNVNYRYTIPQEQDVQQGWLTSSAVQRWWLWYSWWVIPIGMLLLLLPWLIMAGVFERHASNHLGNSNGTVWTSVQQPAPVQTPAVSNPPAAAPPQVNVNIPDNINVTVRNDSPSSASASQPSAEEKANNFWNHVLKRDP
jgi:hypothetical protein